MKIFISLMLFLFLVLPVNINPADNCGKLSDEIIKRHLSVDKFNVISKREINGICELIIEIDGRIIPFYGNSRFLVSGAMYADGVQVTEKKIYEINKDKFRRSINEADLLTAFTYEPVSQKTDITLYMLTDPLCPYCNKIGGEVLQLSERLGFRIKVLLLNVHGERGRAKCIEAICRNEADRSFNFAEYSRPEWKKVNTDKKFLCKKGENLVKGTEEFSEKNGIDSVPFFFINDGSHFSGASIEEVEKLFNGIK